MKKLILAFAVMVMLSGCSSGNPSPDPGVAEELKPGEKSIIQPPRETQSKAPGLEEKTI